MNDDALQNLLNRADEQYQRAQEAATTHDAPGVFVSAVRRRGAQRKRRKRWGALTVIVMLTGFSAWSLTGVRWRVQPDGTTIATNDAQERETIPPVPAEPSPQGRQLSADEVARLQAEIAALDAEASRAHRFVELLQAAELRRERIAQAEAADPPALLSPQALADLEIDRAAATTIVAADAQANKFSRADDAAESYRSILKYFPESRWAVVARERLAFNQMN